MATIYPINPYAYGSPYQMPQIPVGIGAPNVWTLNILTGASGVDLTSVTAVLVTAIPLASAQSGTPAEWTVSIQSQTQEALVAQVQWSGEELLTRDVYLVSIAIDVPGGMVPCQAMRVSAVAPSQVQPTPQTTNVLVVGAINVAARQPIWTRTCIWENGQSLAVGFYGTPVFTTAANYGQKILFDPTGLYLTNPSPGTTLVRVPAVCPVKPITTGGAYPNNIEGQSLPVAAADTLTALAGPTWLTATSSTGQGGQGMAVIQKGGTGNAYAAGIFEIQWLYNLSITAGETFGVLATCLEHGEEDAQYGGGPATPGQFDFGAYLGLAAALQLDAQTDIQAITKQQRAIPMLATQQNSSPNFQLGVAFHDNTTAWAIWQAAIQYPGRIICVGPKYQYYEDGTPDHIHLEPGSTYALVDEKKGQVLDLLAQGKPWTPLQPASVPTYDGVETVTIPMSVPYGPLVADGTVAAPHQAGTQLSMWAAGFGCTVRDRTFGYGAPSGIIVTAVSNTTPIQVTLSGTLPGDGLQTGDQVYMNNVYGTGFPQQLGTVGGKLYTVTRIDAQNFTLDGTTAQGVWNTLAAGYSPIPISSGAIDGDGVVLTIGRAPIGPMSVGIADCPDGSGANLGTGGFGPGRCSILRDSDPFVGPLTGQPQQNWCVECYFDGIVAT